MMQAAGNPFLSLMASAGTGAAPVSPSSQGAGEGQSASGFASLFAGVQSQQTVGGDAVSNAENPLITALKGVLPVLDEIKAAVTDAEDLPTEVSESLLEALDELSELIGNWIEGEPVSVEKLAALLPEDMAEALVSQQADLLSLEMMPPAVVVEIFQQATQDVVLDISKAVAINELPSEQVKSLNLGALVAMVGKVQKAAMTPAPHQHPVAIANGLDQSDDQTVLSPGEMPGEAEGLVDGLETAQMNRISRRAEMGSPREGASSFGEFVQRIAASPAHAAGAIDIPKEMVQVIPEEMASTLQAVTEAQGNTAHAQQVSARPDAPQAKFTQAVIGQLRSVDIQEGTTKIELNPRGLGNVEIEMKTNSDGSLSVVVRAESAHVLSSLREERDLLAQIIAQGGDASVDFQEFTSSDQQSFDGQSGFDGESGVSESGDEVVVEPSQTTTIGNGQLDLMT